MRNIIPRVQLSRNKVVRLVVWLLFATVLAGGALLADSGLGRAEQTLVSAPVPLLGPIPADADLSFLDAPSINASNAREISGSPEVYAASQDFSGRNLQAAREEESGDYEATKAFVPNTSINYLPGWRWDNFILEVSSDGGFLNSMGTLRAIGSSIGSITFSLAALVWMCLLGLLKFGLSIDFLSQSSVAGIINSGITAIATKFWYLMGAFWAFVMFKAVKDFMKGDVKKAVSAGLLFTFAFGALFAIGNLSDGKKSVHSPNTLPHLATKVSSSLDMAAESLGTGFGIASQEEGGANAMGSQGDPSDVLTCQRYMDALYSQYDNANDKASLSNPSTIKVASKLWQNTFGNSWTVAQFGMPKGAVDLPNRTACRQLELQNGIDSDEQARIQTLASDGKAMIPAVAFGPYDTKNGENHRALTAWAACSLTAGGDWGVTAPFKDQVVGRDSGSDRIDAGKCANEFPSKKYDKHTKFNIYYQWGHLMLADTEEHKASRAWNEAFYGGNTGDRITQGVLAFIVSIVFFFSLGFISLGMVAAQFMLVLLLVLFPVTLVFIGIGNANGIRLLKLTGTTAASKFLFALLLTFLTEVISLGQTIITGAQVGNGLFGQLLYGLMPIIALVVVKKILSSAGMGDILKPTGALSFMAASSMAATRDSSLMSTVSKANAQGGFAGIGAKSASKAGSKAASRASAMGVGKRKDGSSVLDRWGTQKQRESAKKRKEKLTQERIAKQGGAGPVASMKYGINRTSEYTKTLKMQGNGSLIKGAGGALAGAGLNGAKALKKGSIALAGGGSLSAVGGTALAAAGLSPLLLGAGVGALAVGGGALALGAAARLSDKNKVAAEPYSVKADKYAKDPDEVKRRSDTEHRMIERATGAEKGVAQRRFVDSVITNKIHGHHGKDFTGYTSVAQEAGAQESYAATMGITRSDVLSSSQGLLTPIPLDLTNKEARRNMTVGSLSHGAHWLDETTKQRMKGEGDDEYVARIHVAMADVGLMSSDGKMVDVLQKVGYDMNVETDRAEVEEWIKGKKNAKLDGVKFSSADSASAARLALKSKIWVQGQQADLVEIEKERARMLSNAIKEAESNLQGLPAITQNITSSMSENNQRFQKALTDHQQATDETVRATTLAVLNEVRKEWDHKVTAHISDIAKKADSSSLISLDLKAPLATDVNALISIADDASRDLNKLTESFDILQSRAFMGDLQALKDLESLTADTFKHLADQEVEIREDAAKNKKAIQDLISRAEQDRSRHGKINTTPRASDYLKTRTRFPG